MPNSADSKPAPAKVDGPIGTDGKPMRMCCACPDTKKPRDQCVMEKGEENCKSEIERHKECLRSLGFKV